MCENVGMLPTGMGGSAGPVRPAQSDLVEIVRTLHPVVCVIRMICRRKIKKAAGQVFPPPFFPLFGESGQSDGGRLTGRVLAY